MFLNISYHGQYEGKDDSCNEALKADSHER